MKVQRQDVLTPANLVTTVGLILTFWGALQLDTSFGFFLVVIGKVFDLIDGPIARRTHTSDFGAAMDASADKLTTFIILISAYYFDLAPTPFLVFLFVQHAVVGALTVISELRGRTMYATILGKHNMFLDIIALLTLVGSNLLGGIERELMWLAGFVLAILSIGYGLMTTFDYIQYFRSPKKKTAKSSKRPRP